MTNDEAIDRLVELRLTVKLPSDRQAIDIALSVLSNRETLSINEAADRVGLSRRSMYNWINSGRVEVVKTASGTQRIVAASLWGKKNNEPPH